MARRTRRNAPLTETQASALRAILSAHSAAPAAKSNPKKRRAGKKRKLTPAHRRKLLANLRKARAAKKHGKKRRTVRRSR